MGHVIAASYAEAVAEGWASLDTALAAHLMGNHIPPVSPVFVPAAKQALALVGQGEGYAEIDLPNGQVLTADEVVEELHLHVFLGEEDD